MELKQAFFGERSLTKVAGLFASKTGADSAVRDLLGASDLTASQVRVLGPPDGAASRAAVLNRAVEPEQRGIWRTIIRAHLTMGILGLLAGVLLYVVLMFKFYPAHQHCMKGTGLDLRTYALDHDGKFPFHTNGFGDAILLLLKEISDDPRMLTAPGDDGRLLKECLKTSVFAQSSMKTHQENIYFYKF